MSDTITPAELENLRDGDTLLLDVRRKSDKDAAPETIPGAVWRDPEQVAQWAADIPSGAKPVLFCVRGGSVSRSTLDALKERGIAARFIEGGIEAWKAATQGGK
ncbi:rhodanese domain protein [Desulfovibrio sp. A2]|nr:rhodanese domain protein [Desulfovibrio sp. A2]